MKIIVALMALLLFSGLVMPEMSSGALKKTYFVNIGCSARGDCTRTSLDEIAPGGYSDKGTKRKAVEELEKRYQNCMKKQDKYECEWAVVHGWPAVVQREKLLGNWSKQETVYFACDNKVANLKLVGQKPFYLNVDGKNKKYKMMGNSIITINNYASRYAQIMESRGICKPKTKEPKKLKLVARIDEKGKLIIDYPD